MLNIKNNIATFIMVVVLTEPISAITSYRTNTPKPKTEAIEPRLLYYYQSESNGIADIQLKVFDNDSFLLILNILEDEETLEYKGTVELTLNSIILNFQSNSLNLTALFDENYDDKDTFYVLDSDTVAINNQKNEIYIYGVACKKF
jgi:hypothetical protein